MISTGSASPWPVQTRAVALRRSDQLAPADVSALTARLERMDRAAEQPWTHGTLRQIQRLPGVVSTELAAEAGQERRALQTQGPSAQGARADRIAGARLSALATRPGLSRSLGWHWVSQ